MNLNEYLEFAKTTALYPNINSNWQYTLIALSGEVGELMNVMKKVLRDDKGIISPEKRFKIIDELGDILWYFVMTCEEFKIDPGTVIDLNIEKLRLRKQTNTIHDKGRIIT